MGVDGWSVEVDGWSVEVDGWSVGVDGWIVEVDDKGMTREDAFDLEEALWYMLCTSQFRLVAGGVGRRAPCYMLCTSHF
jgi:hypothetical protein